MLIFIIISSMLVITTMYFIGNSVIPFLLERSYNKNKDLIEKSKVKDIETKPSILQQAFELESDRKFLSEFFSKNYSYSKLDFEFEPFSNTFFVGDEIFTWELKLEFVRIICAHFNTSKTNTEYEFLNQYPRHNVSNYLNLTYLLSRDNIILLELLKELNTLCLDVIKSTTLDKSSRDYVESILLEHVYLSLKAMYSYNFHMNSSVRYTSTVFKDQFYDKLYFKTKIYVEELKKFSIKSTDLFIKQQFSFIDSASNNFKINKIESLTDDILLKVEKDVSSIEIKVIVSKMKSDLIPKITTWSSNNNISIEDLKTIDIVLDKIINLLENYNSKIYSKQENLSSELAVINRYLGYLEKDMSI